MVKVVNIFKAAGLWVGTIFLLYGVDDVERQVATQYYGGFGTALAPSRSAEAGEVIYGKSTRDTSFGHGGMQMQADIGSIQSHSEPYGGGQAVQKRYKSAPVTGGGGY